MKTEAEIRAAFEAFDWYIAGPNRDGNGRYMRQDEETQNNMIGVLAALDWITGGHRNPIDDTLRNIAAMRAGPRRN